MQNLPPAAVYEKEFLYMPWGKLIRDVQQFLVENVKQGGMLLDILCGPGYLLGQLHKQRPDVIYQGVDMEIEFIRHARNRYPEIGFEISDAMTWNTSQKFDAIICTAGVHHLPDDQQEPFIGKLASLLNPGGFAIIADPYIGDWNTPQERMLKSAELGYESLVATIQNGATSDVIDAAVQILRNDVLLVEWKTSTKRRWAMLEPHFKNIECYKIWPEGLITDWGDYYYLVSN
jgi:trans-aconitate methyltransferase